MRAVSSHARAPTLAARPGGHGRRSSTSSSDASSDASSHSALSRRGEVSPHVVLEPLVADRLSIPLEALVHGRLRLDELLGRDQVEVEVLRELRRRLLTSPGGDGVDETPRESHDLRMTDERPVEPAGERARHLARDRVRVRRVLGDGHAHLRARARGGYERRGCEEEGREGPGNARRAQTLRRVGLGTAGDEGARERTERVLVFPASSEYSRMNRGGRNRTA